MARGVLAGFNEQVRALPSGAVAIEDGALVWTYVELDRQAWRAAHALSTLGGATPVALAARPGAAALAVMLGALRAGRVIAPLEARAATLNQLGADVLIGDVPASDLSPWPGTVVSIADVLGRGAAERDPSREEPPFVLFSSGSTARPKGVIKPSAMVAEAARSYREVFGLRPGDRTAWMAPIAFSASLSAAFGTLLAGGTLVALDPRCALGELIDALEAARVTHLHLVPSLFRRLARAAGPGRLRSIRVVKLGGEAATAGDLALFRAAFPRGAVLFNGLGATETGHVAFARFDHDSVVDPGVLPIGLPADGIVVAIVDDALAPVAEGDAGRLAIGGEALAVGYWSDPERSACAFRDQLGAGAPHAARWFVSGDVARRRADGQLEHLGRADDLVKVRGKPVLLGEVEAALVACAGVDDAVVVAVPHASLAGEHWLAGFVVGAAPGAQAFASWPEHQRLARVVVLEALPRLANGKVDRQALGARLARPNRDEEVAPTVRAVMLAFEHALGIEHVAADEDFFALGGHSLAAVEIVAELARRLAGASRSRWRGSCARGARTWRSWRCSTPTRRAIRAGARASMGAARCARRRSSWSTTRRVTRHRRCASSRGPRAPGSSARVASGAGDATGTPLEIDIRSPPSPPTTPRATRPTLRPTCASSSSDRSSSRRASRPPAGPTSVGANVRSAASPYTSCPGVTGTITASRC